MRRSVVIHLVLTEGFSWVEGNFIAVWITIHLETKSVAEKSSVESSYLLPLLLIRRLQQPLICVTTVVDKTITTAIDLCSNKNYPSPTS